MKCHELTAMTPVTWTSYNEKTGEAIAAAPLTAANKKFTCKVTKQWMEGTQTKFDSKSFEMFIEPAAKSRCSIGDFTNAPKEIESGKQFGAQLAMTIDASTQKPMEVKDVNKQCPGDKFYLECAPKMDWIKFTPETARISVYAPKVKAAMEVVCSVSKKSTNGQYELKKHKFSVMPPTGATPPANCK